ncbi:MAG: Pycsar system effector family protein [Salibacteraceae bacterium]
MEKKTHFSEVKRSGSIDYMLRTAQQHHAQLSMMADNKANIMVATNTVLITLVMSRFDFSEPIWALVSLLITSFFALVAAIVAVYPFNQRGMAKPKAIKTENPLFFGTFSRYQYDDFAEKMADMMQQDDSIYEALVNDLYQLGVYVKETKYKYIRISYQIFFLGLFVSLVLFLIQLSDLVNR